MKRLLRDYLTSAVRQLHLDLAEQRKRERRAASGSLPEMHDLSRHFWHLIGQHLPGVHNLLTKMTFTEEDFLPIFVPMAPGEALVVVYSLRFYLLESDLEYNVQALEDPDHIEKYREIFEDKGMPQVPVNGRYVFADEYPDQWKNKGKVYAQPI